MDAGVAIPEQSECRLLFRARRSGIPAERLDCVEIVRVGGASQSSRWSRPELGVVVQDEHRGECQPLRTHRSERRRCWPPLSDRGSTDERRVARVEPISSAPGKHGLRYLGSPGDPALARLAAVLAIRQCRQRGRITGIQCRLLRWKQADQRCVRGGDDRSSTRCAAGRALS